MLLKGSELARYQQLIFSGMGKEPPPATLQIDYVESSQEAVVRAKKRRMKFLTIFAVIVRQVSKTR